MKKWNFLEKKLGTLTDNYAFNFIVHDAVKHLCSSSNFSKTSHQTSNLFTTTVGARWQYFPTRNERGINDFCWVHYVLQ